MTYRPGLRERVLFGSKTVKIEVLDLKPTPFQASLRTKDTFTRLYEADIAFDDGSLPPDRVEKYELTVTTSNMQSDALEYMHRLRARPGFIDVCLWHPISEWFSGDGSTGVATTLRREALSRYPITLPPSASSKFPTLWEVDGTAATFAAGTPDERGCTPWTASSTPAAGSSNISVLYVPLFRMYLTEDQPLITGMPGHQEARRLVYMEG